MTSFFLVNSINRNVHLDLWSRLKLHPKNMTKIYGFMAFIVQICSYLHVQLSDLQLMTLYIKVTK